VLDGKYGHHLPLDRQSKIFARQKIVLHRPMLADLAARASHLCTCLASYIRPLIFGFSIRVSRAGGRMFNAY
jgi:transposase